MVNIIYATVYGHLFILFYRSMRMSHQNKTSLEISCLSAESRTQECVKIESHFDNGIVQSSPVLMTGIVKLRLTFITRIVQYTAHQLYPGDNTCKSGGQVSKHLNLLFFIVSSQHNHACFRIGQDFGRNLKDSAFII